MTEPIILPFPPSGNNLYDNAGKGRRKTSRYAKWIVAAGQELMIQRPQKFTEPVAVHIIAAPPDRRLRDSDNIQKPLLDLLVRHQVIQDDNNRFVKDLRTTWLDEKAGKIGIVVSRYKKSAVDWFSHFEGRAAA